MNCALLEPVPPGVVTEIDPLVAPAGTIALICPSFTAVNTALVPLNRTDVAPERCDPPICTVAPAAAPDGVNPLTLGAAIVTVNVPLVATPPDVVTVTAPVVAPTGTWAVICPSLLTTEADRACPVEMRAADRNRTAHRGRTRGEA